MRRRILFTFLFFIFTTDLTYAAGILMRVQQMKAMKQQQAQMTQQQYEAYQEQQQQQGGAPGQPAAPAQPTYQQTVDQRNQAIAQAILSSHNQSVTSDSVPFGNDAQVNTSPAIPVSPVAASQQQQALPQTGSSEVKDVVDLSEVWKKLDTRSTVWTLLIDDQAKALTVSEYIDRFHKQGVKINEPPEHYVQMIDQIVSQNPEMLDRPFGELVQIVAIVDYDFDNGMDKDALARKVLGEQGFEANKQRFTQQQPSGGSGGR